MTSNESWAAALVASAITLVAAPAHAQGSAVRQARADLATYDIEGTATLRAIADLAPIASSSGPDAHEARYLRAAAAADLHVLALALGDAALDARLAEALDVPVDAIEIGLRVALRSVDSGLYARAAEAELALLDAADEFAAGHAPREHSARGFAALFALAVSRSTTTPELAEDAPVVEAACPSWLVGPPCERVQVLREGLASLERASHRAAHGDALLVGLRDRLDRARATITSTDVVVPPALPGELADAIAAGDGALGATPDLVVVVDEARVLFACGARVRVLDTVQLDVRSPSAACPELGTTREIALAAAVTAPRAIDELVTALVGLSLPRATTVAIAPTETAPVLLITRTVRSLQRAHLEPSLVALRSPTGALSTSPLSIRASEERASERTVHVRLGGYAVQPAHGRGPSSQLPRIRGDAGLHYDHEGLAVLAHGAGHEVIWIDAMDTVRASELARALRILASDGAAVVLGLP